MYDSGRGVAQDLAEAAKWYQKAAEQGLHGAEFSLGLKYMNGQGVERDCVQAYKWMNLATRDADVVDEIRCAAIRDRVASSLSPAQVVEAQRLVRESIDECGDPDFQFDYAEAVRWWRKAADAGNADAQYNLGLAYLNEEVGDDYGEPVLWFRKAAEQGHAEALFTLGWMYDSCFGVPRDYAEAVRWYRKAADQGFAGAQHNLGRMYYNGFGVPQDYVQAYMWASLAASVSTEDDRKKYSSARDAIAARMTPGQVADAQRLTREWRPTSARDEGHRA